MTRELSLTGEQVAELQRQIIDMVDPLTGELHVEFIEDGSLLAQSSDPTPEEPA